MSEVEVRTQNEVMTGFINRVIALFATGSPTATVYANRFQQMTTKPCINLYIRSTAPSETICSEGSWGWDRRISLQALLIGKDREEAYALWERLQDLLEIGKFREAITPMPTASFYVELGIVVETLVDSEDYGLTAPFELYFMRTKAST